MTSTADGRNNRNFRFFHDRGGEAAGVADVLVTDEDIDVLADLTLLVDKAVLHAGVERPKSGQSVCDSSAGQGDFHDAATGSEIAQSSRNVDGDRHSYLRLERRDFCRRVDLESVAGLDGGEVVRDSFTARTGIVEPSSIMAQRTHTIEGKLS